MKEFMSGLAILFFSTVTYCAETDPRVDLVVDLYKEYAWEAVIEEPMDGTTIHLAPVTTLRHFFTEELSQLIVADREYMARTHEIGRIDFALLWASQDPDATRLKIRSSSSPDEVEVSYTSPSNRSEIRIIYEVSLLSSGEARISDIRYGHAGSLKASLQAPQ
ncbi:MAG: hypothetical protein V4812_21710 [Pseudomonadota bacterium]